MSARCLIVSGDDLGLTTGHNRAIEQAHTQGVLTSTSLLANGQAFDDAVVRTSAYPDLGIGVHLTLLEGMPVRPRPYVRGLVRNGRFGDHLGALFWKLALGQAQLAQVRDEWRAQIVKILAADLTVTHLDSDKHIHMHPQLLGVALALAHEYGIARMRLSRPPHWTGSLKAAALALLSVWARWRMVQHGIRAPNALLGLANSGRMSAARVIEAIQPPWQGVRELMMHPAHPTQALAALSERGYRWIARYRFQGELAALCAPQVQRALSEMDVTLVNYSAV